MVTHCDNHHRLVTTIGNHINAEVSRDLYIFFIVLVVEIRLYAATLVLSFHGQNIWLALKKDHGLS